MIQDRVPSSTTAEADWPLPSTTSASAACCPAVSASGFTHPTNEFATSNRVIISHANNSCWNDAQHRFDHNGYLWCPRRAGTPRKFASAMPITAAPVKRAIQELPGSGMRAIPLDSITRVTN